jgi:hypothetical protein
METNDNVDVIAMKYRIVLNILQYTFDGNVNGKNKYTTTNGATIVQFITSNMARNNTYIR